MKQSINLLDSLPFWEKSKYSPKFALFICLGFLVLLLAYYGFDRYMVSSKAGRVAPIQQEILTLRSKVSTIREEITTTKDNQEASIKRQKALFDALPEHGKNGGQDFHNILNSLSMNIPASVWLTTINIDESKKNITLHGHALSAQGAMTFVSNLNKDPMYADLPFKLQNLHNFSQEKYMSIQVVSQPSNNN